jgi:hypothetical protein
MVVMSVSFGLVKQGPPPAAGYIAMWRVDLRRSTTCRFWSRRESLADLLVPSSPKSPWIRWGCGNHVGGITDNGCFTRAA